MKFSVRKILVAFAAISVITLPVKAQTADAHAQAHASASAQAHTQAMEIHRSAHESAMDNHRSALEEHNRAVERFNRAFRDFEEDNLIEERISATRVRKMKKETSYISIPANDASIRYTGRTLAASDGSVSFDWSGTYLEVTFTGGYIAMRVSDTKKNYYNVFIDGFPAGTVETFGKDSLIVLAGAPDKREHTLRLQKRSEGEQGTTTIHSFELAKGGKLLKFEPGRNGLIEFIGDSITAGYGTEAKSKSEPFKAQTENCNLAYGAIISRYFNTDYTFIAHSGRGAARNYGDTARVSKNSMKERMMQTFDENPAHRWNFKSYKPSLVIINLGSNDFSTKPHPQKEEFLGAYSIIIAQIREVYGDVPVLCVAPPKGAAFDYLQSFCKEKGDNNLHFAAYLNGVYGGDGDLGASAHPNYNGQKKIAMNLIPYISSIMGWELTGKAAR